MSANTIGPFRDVILRELGRTAPDDLPAAEWLSLLRRLAEKAPEDADLYVLAAAQIEEEWRGDEEQRGRIERRQIELGLAEEGDRKKQMEWAALYSRASSGEGWDVFDRGGGCLQIQRLDFPKGEEGGTPRAPLFSGDDDAIRYVIDRAAGGSKRHHLALLLTRETDERVKALLEERERERQ